MNHRLTITAALAVAAASTGLFPLIAGGKWFWGGIGAIILVAAIGSVTRLRLLPPALCLLAALAGLLLWLNVVYAGKPSFLHLFPTGASLAQLWRLFVQGLNETQRYASPVPPLRGIVLLATAGIGLVAALTDLTAVRLRRCALAGLPLLVLFSVPVASGAGKNTLGDAIVFCLGMAGYLALLSADGRERLRLWGRLVTPWNPAPDEPAEELGSGPSTRALAASGRRIGLAAVVLALVVPVLVPSLQAHKIFPSNHGSGFGPGSGPGGPGLDPIVQMTDQLREAKSSVVLTYHTNDPHPQYLQMYVLGVLTDTSWTPSRLGEADHVSGNAQLPQLPGPLARGVARTASTSIAIAGNALARGHFLPAPYEPRQLLNIPGDWEADPGTLMLYSGSQSLDGLKYTVNSLDVDPSQAQLDEAPAGAGPMSRYTYVPPAYQSLRHQANKIVKGADSPGAKALDLENYFRKPNNFSYTVDPPTPPPGMNAVKYFLQQKQGFCQQFAFAMAVLARLVKIPSRVVVGYTAGTRTGPGPATTGPGNYVVRTSDAHAWPELYFQGFGWLRMEPTPSGTGIGQGTAIPPTYGAASGAGSTGSGPNTSKGVAPGGAGGRRAAPGGNPLGHKAGYAEGDVRAGAKKSNSGLPPLLIALAALLVIGLVTPRVTRSLLRRRRWLTAHTDAARAHAAWAELLDDLDDYGIRHGPGETPRAVEQRVARRLRLAGPGRQALLRITQAEERASYAREPGSSGTLRADVTAVRGAMSASVTRGARWQARLLPGSAVERTRRAVSHALDLFGWLEVATGRARRRLARARAAHSG